MGSVKKKGVKVANGSDKTAKGAGQGIRDTAMGFVDEAEKTGAALVGEVKELFDNLTHKVAGVASAAADTTASMAGKVTIKEPAELVRGLLEDVKDASEASLRMIGKGFDELRDSVLSSSGKASSGTAKGKKATVKKAASAKKKAAKKATSKTTQRAAKKVVKKTTKKAAKKTAKKAAKKKTAKKSTAKKVATKKTAARKKASPRKARAKT